MLLAINLVGTVYTKNNLPAATVKVERLTDTGKVQAGQYADDPATYHILNIGAREPIDPTLFTPAPGRQLDVKPGRYLIDDAGHFAYLCDPAINGELKEQDDGTKVIRFAAPKTQLVALIIDGIFDRNVPWDLVLIGVLIAVALELAGVPSLPFAVGVYLPISSSMPIFVGGMLRWLVDKLRRAPAADSDSSPGVLLSSGYIAGGAIAALLAAMLGFDSHLQDAFDFGRHLKGVKILGEPWPESNLPVGLLFGGLILVLIVVGVLSGRTPAGKAITAGIERGEDGR